MKRIAGVSFRLIICGMMSSLAIVLIVGDYDKRLADFLAYYSDALIPGLLVGLWAIWNKLGWLTSIVGSFLAGLAYFYGLAISAVITGTVDLRPSASTSAQDLVVYGLAIFISFVIGLLSCLLINWLQNLFSQNDKNNS